MKYDQILVAVGEFGTFQKRVFAWMCLFLALASWDITISVFVLYQPKHRCQLPDYPNDTYLVQSPAHLYLINQTIPLDEKGKYSSCLAYAASGKNSTLFPHSNASDVSEKRKCEKWVYDRSIMKSTLTEKLDIVCDRTILRAHQYLVTGIGTSVSVFLVGFLSDWLGRQKTFLLFLLVEVAAMFGNAFISSDAGLLLLRFLVTLGDGGTYVAIYVMGIEIVGPSKRMWTSQLNMIMWAVNQLWMGLLALLLRDWQHLTLALSAPAVIFFAFYWLMPESPRWLLSRGRRKEAIAIIQRMAKVNKVDTDPSVFEAMTLEEEPSESLLHLFKERRLVVRYSVLVLNWCAIALVYYGLVFNVSNLTGSLHLNFFLSVAVEILSYVTGLLLLNRLGRRFLLVGSMLASGLVCLSTIIPVLLESGEQVEEVSLLVLSNLGKMFISAGYAIIYIYSSELLPTVCRGTGLGLCITVSRLGTLLAPYMADLGLYVQGTFGRVLPLLVLGGGAMVAGGLALILPETLHRRLPETVQDAVNFDRCELKQESSDTRVLSPTDSTTVI